MVGTNAEAQMLSMEKRVQCTFCDKMISSSTNLRTHMVTVHSSADTKKHRCAICQKTFTRICDLNNHMHSHERRKPNEMFKCEPCTRFFGSLSTLLSHQQNHKEHIKFHDYKNTNLFNEQNLCFHVTLVTKSFATRIHLSCIQDTIMV